MSGSKNSPDYVSRKYNLEKILYSETTIGYIRERIKKKIPVTSMKKHILKLMKEYIMSLKKVYTMLFKKLLIVSIS